MIQDRVKQNSLSFKNLIIQLKDIKEKSFSGNLIIKVDSAPSWIVSFRAGRLGWISGGIEYRDCWQRNLALATVDLSPDKLAEVNNPQKTALDSHTLAQLLSQRSIDQEQCAALVARMATESLFDIIQFSQHSGNRLYYQLNETGADNSQLNLILPLIEIEPILTKSIQTWQEWSNHGLAAYSPSLFPIFSKSPEAVELIANSNLNQVVLSIDGNRTLRSLATNYRQSVLTFTSALLPLLRSGFITLSHQAKSIPSSGLDINSGGFLTGEISNGSTNLLYKLTGTSQTRDIQTKIENLSPGSGFASINNGLLIACIDDSILIYQALEKVLTEHGYRSYGVQDPLKIMPSLIRNKPDFIFLDLLMPITNGYEVCEQIRKTPSLKDIPVIILTGKDGLVDRMRSKMVGATGFMSKPVNPEMVLKMLEKYLVGVN